MAFTQAVFEEYRLRWQARFSPQARLRLGAAPLAALAGCTDLALAEVAGHSLSAHELERWTGFSRQKRSVEWLGGRLAAKWACAEFLNQKTVNWQELVIRTEEDGRPFLAVEAPAVAPFISISHSGPLAAAMAANFPCGLDIQQPGAKIRTVRECFALPEEEALLKGLLPESFTEMERLTLLWAAKEAVRKTVRVSPLLGLLEMRMLAGQGGRGVAEEPLALICATGREQDGCPPTVSVLCFFADNLAWAMAFTPITGTDDQEE